jgi:hypothetical protein
MLADVKTDPYESSCVVLFRIGTGRCCGLPKVHGHVYTGTKVHGTRSRVHRVRYGVPGPSRAIRDGLDSNV